MPRYFTHYWKNDTWENHRHLEGTVFMHTAGGMFRRSKISPDDEVYFITVRGGLLYLGGKLVVRKVCDIDETAKFLNRRPSKIWEAPDHVIGSKGTLMHFDVEIPQAVT